MKSGHAFLVRKSDGIGHWVSRGRQIFLGLSSALLVFAPLAYGAVHNWAYFTVGLLVAAMSLGLAGLGLYYTLSPTENMETYPYPSLWWLGVGLVLLLLIQLIPWPQEAVRWVSPEALQIRALGTGAGLSPYLPFSLNPNATLLENLKIWPALVLFFLLLYLINTRQQLQRLVWLFVGVALFEVLYGFWNFHSKSIWGYPNIYTGSRLCGTFINSNHLAGFLTLAILLGFGLFLGQRQEIPLLKRSTSRKKSLGDLSRAERLEPRARSNIVLIPLFVLVVGLVFTGSRGGMLSLIVGLAFLALLIYSQRWRRSHIPTILIFLALALSYSVFLGRGPFLARFLDLHHEGRYHACLGALAIFREFPWVGSGVGTFGDLFSRFQPANLAGYRFDYVHNDWLQLLAETGVAGFTLVAAAWLIFLSGLVKQWQRCQDRFTRGLGLGGLAALAAGSFNALTEFLFHIPAYSLLFAALAAITYLAVHFQPQGSAGFSYPKLSNRRGGLLWGLLPALIIIQLVFVFQVSQYWRAEAAAPTEINSMRLPPLISLKDYRRALKFNPWNSRYYEGLAESLMKKGLVTEEGFAEVEDAWRLAVRWAPAHWRFHYRLAEFYLDDFPKAPYYYIPLAFSELSASLALFPNSALLHLRMAQVLAWSEKYFPELIPENLRHSREFHAQRAVALKPQFKKYLKPQKSH
ncbi:MAG: O-antigen ligase family protein [Syntrophobacterales bacterium]